MQDAAKTFYAPADRASEADLLLQIRLVAEVPIIQDLFDSMPVFVAILNQHRQIIFANKQFASFLKTTDLDSFLGKRPGEAINCAHSHECAGGCGSSEACSVCGAVNAILLSQKNGSSGMECRITLENGDPLDLLIFTNQHKILNSHFTVFTAMDISSQNRRKALERIFFHDLLNTTGALKGFLDMMKNAPEAERDEYINFSKNIAEHLVEEIMCQKELALAEDHELHITPSLFSTHDILKETIMVYEKHMVSIGKPVLISPQTDDVVIGNDKTLIRRIIGNLVKNALEANDEGESVELCCKKENDAVIFSVSNPKVMTKSVRLQIFQRSFSTKGQGRGLGTYSVKLLAERYLKGKVSFISEEGKGTTFYVRFPLDIDI